jgi:serine/threonine-protein kinase
MYALGVLLYEMATGDVPFKGETREGVTSLHRTAAPTPPSQIRVGLDPRTEQVILKALSKSPQDRYASARDMVADLEREEPLAQYTTVAFDRALAQEVRKRQSEIIRFRLSRTDEPIEEIKHVALSGTQWPLIAAGIVCLIVFLAALAVILLL